MRPFLISAFLLCLVAAASITATPGDTVKSIPLPSGYTQGLAYDGKFLWSADRRSDLFYKFDPADGKRLDSFPAPGYAITGITFDGKWLWAVDAEAGQLFAFDPNTRLVERTLAGPVSQPGGLAWDGKYLWIADAGDSKLHQIDANDGTTIISIPSPTKTPGALAFDGRYLWVADRTRDEIYMVTTDRGDVLITFNSPGKYSSGLAIDSKNLWVADYQSDRCYQMVVDDGVQFWQKDKKVENIEYVHQVTNFGPDTITSLQVYIAVPQNLNSQTLLGDVQFTPKPVEFVTDKWGQKIARFEFTNLAAGQASAVTMNVKAELQRVRYFVFPAKVGKLADIPAEIRKQYLVDDVKFQFTSPVIQDAVKAAVGSETNPYWIGRKIFNYINEKLFYERVGGWNTAPTVLQRGNGSCSEYSFVYIAMCRAAGLPARYVGSVVVRGDDACWDDVFHRWVEIYLPNYGWIPVDPSGGDQPTPQGQAAGFGNLDNRFLITTTSGGGSEYLDWTYNANERWISKGKCKISVENFAEWTPGEKQK